MISHTALVVTVNPLQMGVVVYNDHTKTNKTGEIMFDKMMSRMFRKVDGVVFDLTTNSIGIRKDDSVFTMGEDGSLNENLFADMSAAIPAFARATPLNSVKIGDLLVSQSGDPFGFVTKINEKSLGVLKTNGTNSTVSPAKVNLLGQGQTVLIVGSIDVGGMDPMMLMAMSEGEDNSDLFMMMSMMNQTNGTDSGQSMMNNPMMMMAMMKGKGGGSNDMMKMMMLQQMMGQQGQSAAMNPMMMAMMMGKLNG